MKARRLLLVAAVLALATGCRTQSPMHGTATVGVENSPAPVAEAPAGRKHIADAAVAQMDFWLSLAMPPQDTSEGVVVTETEGIRVTNEEYEAGLQERLAGAPRTAEAEEAYKRELAEEARIIAWAQRQGVAASPTFRAKARRQLRRELADVALRDLAKPAPVTDADVKALYDQRQDRYLQPERVQIRMILVASDEEARAILDRLTRGEAFGALAAELSRDPSRRTYGEIQPFRRGTFNRDVEEKAFALQPGETGTVTTPAGSFVIQKVAHLPATTVPFATVKAELRRELEAQRLAAARAEFLDKIGKE